MILAEREIPRLLSCEDVALFVHDVPNVSLLLSFCAPLSSCPRAARGSPPPSSFLPVPSMRPLALLFRSPSFTLPRCSRRRYGRFDAEERRYQDDDLDFFSLGSSIDPPTQNVILLCAFSLRKRFKNISNECDRLITSLKPFKSLKLFRSLL